MLFAAFKLLFALKSIAPLVIYVLYNKLLNILTPADAFAPNNKTLVLSLTSKLAPPVIVNLSCHHDSLKVGDDKVIVGIVID